MLCIVVLAWVAVVATDASAADRDPVERTARTTVGTDPSILVIAADRPTGQTKRAGSIPATPGPDAREVRAERPLGARLVRAEGLALEHPLALGLARRGPP